MAVKKPGFNNAVSNRNRRVNRYAATGDNIADRRHKEVRADTIAYDTGADPDEITDSGDGLAGFEINERIDTQGSDDNDGVDVVQSVLAGALGVDDSVTAESAGADIVLRSRNNRIESRLA